MIEKPASVRFATKADEPAIYSMLLQMHLVSKFARMFPYDPETVYKAIRIGTERKGGIIGVLVDANNQDNIIGLVGLLVDRWWWTRDAEFLRLEWLFIKKEYRRQGYEEDLFRFAEWCRETMAENLKQLGEKRPFLLEWGFIALDRVEGRERLWRRLGKKINSGFHKVSVGFLSGL